MNFFTKRKADLTARSSLKGQRKKVLLPAKQLNNDDFLYLEGNGHCLNLCKLCSVSLLFKYTSAKFQETTSSFVNTLTNAKVERKTQNRTKQIRGKISGYLET